jgi:hypothetical protein
MSTTQKQKEQGKMYIKKQRTQITTKIKSSSVTHTPYHSHKSMAVKVYQIQTTFK